MSVVRKAWIPLLLVAVVGGAIAVAWSGAKKPRTTGAATGTETPRRAHVNHAPFFAEAIDSPEAVTRACLKCHPTAAREVMATSHFQWLGAETLVPGHEGPRRIGKRNLLNNFCIGITGNQGSCTRCHAGYGWKDDSFDFAREETVDCLVCHERSGQYVKGPAGIPEKTVDLAAAARSVGYPTRENCGVCHNYGGGGQGVKHGDLDESLVNPYAEDDVHMGRLGFLCIDCHRTEQHRIRGRSFSVGVDHQGGMDCVDCHRDPPHRDKRINAHLDAVSCQACHIPTFANRLPTKTQWDWSKAGDGSRPDDPHRYLKIKGEFVYDSNIVPEYRWFNWTMDRYLLGDPVDPEGVTDINTPRGARGDGKIRPFKVHLAKQPYDAVRRYLLPPVTAGEGGFWKEFDWAKALALGAKASGIEFSGEYGFAWTRMYWPLSHMVAPKERALACKDCHGEGGRMDWAALGYDADPAATGGGL